MSPSVPSHWLSAAQAFYRNSAAALIATVADYIVYIFCVNMLGVAPPWATVAACIIGAVVNFTINRRWTFQSTAHVGPQAVRYALVSAAAAGWSGLGVKFLLQVTPWDFRVAWVVVLVAVSWGWNLPLQRYFVFPK